MAGRQQLCCVRLARVPAPGGVRGRVEIWGTYALTTDSKCNRHLWSSGVRIETDTGSQLSSRGRNRKEHHILGMVSIELK